MDIKMSLYQLLKGFPPFYIWDSKNIFEIIKSKPHSSIPKEFVVYFSPRHHYKAIIEESSIASLI